MPDLAGGGNVGGAGVSRMPNVGAGGLPSGFRSSQSTAVTIHILQGATVQSGADVEAAIERAIPNVVSAVHQTNYQNQRLMGNYASETY